MGRLRDFRSYLDDRRARVAEIEHSLVSLQEHYESYFAELSRVRETELMQLTERFSANRAGLGEELDEKVQRTRSEVAAQLDGELAELQARVLSIGADAEQQRQASIAAERALRTQNVELDRSEEALKVRSEQLRQRIEGFNERIRKLGTGFGFFAHFFRMREVQKERRGIEQEQDDVLARIEALRVRWALADEDHAALEQSLRERWVKLRSEATALQTKLDYLTSAKERIVTRTTMERILFELVAQPKLGGDADPKCARCERPNPAANHFCAYCAQRLGEDRRDLRGSWEEIAEVNHHHAVFSDGMKSCQELIGLMRGVGSGIDAFAKSVDDMIDTETRHPVAKLSIDVPGRAVQYGKQLDVLAEHLKIGESRHPTVFAGRVQQLLAGVFDEHSIQQYFETMGAELSRQAEAQW